MKYEIINNGKKLETKRCVRWSVQQEVRISQFFILDLLKLWATSDRAKRLACHFVSAKGIHFISDKLDNASKLDKLNRVDKILTWRPWLGMAQGIKVKIKYIWLWPIFWRWMRIIPNRINWIRPGQRLALVSAGSMIKVSHFIILKNIFSHEVVYISHYLVLELKATSQTVFANIPDYFMY